MGRFMMSIMLHTDAKRGHGVIEASAAVFVILKWIQIFLQPILGQKRLLQKHKAIGILL